MASQSNSYNPLLQSPWIHERSWVGVQENLRTNDVVLIPVGAVEQHGAHTPHMVDMCWATAMAEGVAAATGAIIAPPIYAGYSSGHMAYPGSLTIRGDVLRDYIVDVARSLMLYGYKKFFLINGNRVANLPPMMMAARQIHLKHGAYSTCLDAGLMTLKENAELVHMPGGLEHAGDAETSFMLHYRPEFVDMSKAGGDQPPSPDPEAAAYYAGAHTVVDPLLSSYMLPARKHMETSQYATPEKGEEILRLLVEKCVGVVKRSEKIEVTLHDLEVPI